MAFGGVTTAVTGGNAASKLVWSDTCPLLAGTSFPALTLFEVRPAKVASGVSSSLSSSLESDSFTSSSLSDVLMSVWGSGGWSVDGGAEGAPGESFKKSGSADGDCARASRADIGGVLNKSWSLEGGDNSAFVTAWDSLIFGVDSERSSLSGLFGMLSTSGARLTSSLPPKT